MVAIFNASLTDSSKSERFFGEFLMMQGKCLRFVKLKTKVEYEVTYEVWGQISSWTEILRKHITVLGEGLSLWDGIMGSFYCFFILSSIFKLLHHEHLLLWSSENRVMVRQPTLLVLADSGPHFLLTPFCSAPNTLCPPWLLQGGSGGKGWDVRCCWCPELRQFPWGSGSLWACRNCMCSIQVPGGRFLELYTWKKKAPLKGNFASTEWSHLPVRNSGSRTPFPRPIPTSPAPPRQCWLKCR